MKPFPKFSQKKLISYEDIASKSEALKKDGKRIATINGSFDLMHAGHLHILYEGSLQADVLWVLLNSDSSIQQYKSPDRPIIDLYHRLVMMSCVEFVTLVSWFDEVDPKKILAKIQPHVHINGQEYGQDCLEAETVRQGGGKIHIVDLVPGLSTSQIINKISGKCD
jgi:D-glycero-beta-D-manno-heptose 1-phosphate adenylyltransferase